MHHLAQRRHSKFTEAVKNSLEYFGHATNAQLATDLRRSYPHISDTTVHRITQRLIADELASIAGRDMDGAVVIDSNTDEHDHMSCRKCGTLKDIVVPENCRRDILEIAGNCRLPVSLTVTAICEECL